MVSNHTFSCHNELLCKFYKKYGSRNKSGLRRLLICSCTHTRAYQFNCLSLRACDRRGGRSPSTDIARSRLTNAKRARGIRPTGRRPEFISITPSRDLFIYRRLEIYLYTAVSGFIYIPPSRDLLIYHSLGIYLYTAVQCSPAPSFV